MVKCTCVRCYKDFMTPIPSWWCDDCKMAEFEKRQKKKPATNGDRIRAMSDEELTKLLSAPCPLFKRGRDKWCGNPMSCRKCIAEWLKQPAEEDAHE